MMTKGNLLNQLETYYKNNGILSTSFTCTSKIDCKGDCDSFTGPKSAFVGKKYESSELPRLLFLSLDSGSGDPVAENRLPISVMRKEMNRDLSSLHKHKHWYRTHELAWHILKAFDSELKIECVKNYFAHANSAKCCMNKKQRKKADKILFRNCRKYLQGELQILNPAIIVTQGAEAKKAIEYITDNIVIRVDDFASVIKMNGRDVFWLHTYHPNNWGAFNKQRIPNKNKREDIGWDFYAKEIRSYLST